VFDPGNPKEKNSGKSSRTSCDLGNLLRKGASLSSGNLVSYLGTEEGCRSSTKKKLIMWRGGHPRVRQNVLMQEAEAPQSHSEVCYFGVLGVEGGGTHLLATRFAYLSEGAMAGQRKKPQAAWGERSSCSRGRAGKTFAKTGGVRG